MKTKSFFEPLSPAEKLFLDGCHLGNRIDIGSERPDSDTTDKEIRADLIRCVLLEAMKSIDLHAKGVRIKGARITGTLDLQGVDLQHDISFSKCILEKRPNLINARVRGLHLSDTSCPGISADNAQFDGSVFLRSGFQATDEISMPGAKITGDLQICEADIRSKTGFAIFAASAQIGGSVYLGDYPYDDRRTELNVDGSIMFTSATIRRDFYCFNCAIYAGDQSMTGIGRDGPDGHGEPVALSLNRADIGGVLFFKQNQITRGIVNFAGLATRRLNDEPADEQENFKLRLDGFEYQGFSDQADIRLKSRLDWLNRRPEGLEFSSQPYEHLANILFKVGHRNDALDVLFEKEKQRNHANRAVLRREGRGLWRIPILVFNDRLLRYMIGYGYRPFLSLLWGCVLIGALAVLYQKTWDAGDFAPNAAPILVSSDWIKATETHPSNPAEFWSSKGQAGQDYETFQALAYAADIVIPIVNLGQEDAWAPSTSRSVLGEHAWWVRWVAKIFGWVITALGAAAVTSAIRHN